MNKIFKKVASFSYSFLGIFLFLFFIIPFILHATIIHSEVLPEIGQSDNNVTVTIHLDSILDIDGCESSSCKYWQIHFQEIVDDWGRYYSSDVYPASQLDATYTFHLPVGNYAGVFLAGYKGSNQDYCNFIIPDDFSDSCPDGKHIIDDIGGLIYVNDPSTAYPLIIKSSPSKTRVTSFVSGTSYFLNISKTDKVFTEALLPQVCHVTASVSTALINDTWAEISIFKKVASVDNNASFKKLGFVDVSTVFNSTGEKSVDVNLEDIAKGDDLWIVLGSKASTPFQIRGVSAKNIISGAFQTASMRPSLLGEEQFIINTAIGTLVPPWIGIKCE